MRMQHLDSLWSPLCFLYLFPHPTFMAFGKFRKLASSLMANNTCISLVIFFLFPYLSNGRAPPWLSPFPAPLLTRQVQPISAIPTPVAPSPIEMQVAIDAQHHHLSKEVIITISLCSAAITVIALSAIFVWIFWRRNHKDCGSKAIQASDYATKGLSLAPVFGKLNSLKMVSKKGLVAMMEYASLELATNNFSENNVLGKGEMSCVYKACFDGGIVAAVKKLDGSGQDHERRFDSELDLLGRIRHPNIVSLLGYCIHGESKFLVYELLQNGSLETLLHGPSRGSSLTWHMRMKIALDIARGLEYLHESCNPPVIHRDLVSSNILLDAEFNVKISDFGLAVCGGHQTKASCKLSGTLGYVAPEYVLDGKLTEKSDVYAFGVILLELLMGRERIEKMAPSQFQSIVTWAMPQLTDRLKLPSIVDPVIRDTMNPKHLYQVAAVAVLCIQPEPCYRPLITDVLHSLVPLVPVELGGTLRVADRSPHAS